MEMSCRICGRDNDNQTHDALEAGGHLNHSFTPGFINTQQALKMIETEFITASIRYPKFNSAHEGWAVIKEELDELWDEIKNDSVAGSQYRQIQEAKQVAAMACRFIIDLSGRL